MSTEEASTIPVEEVKKEDTKPYKKGHAKTNKGPNSKPVQDDRKDFSGRRKNHTSGGKKSEVTYVKKAAKEGEAGQEGADQEEQKEGQTKKTFKPRYEKKEYTGKWVFDSKSVTLETPIPLKPTQKELLTEPKREALNSLIDSIEKKMEEAKNKKNKKIQEVISRDKNVKTETSEQSTPLRDQLKELYNQQKAQREVFDKLKVEHEAKEQEISVVFRRANEIRQKMKKIMSADELRESIEQLQYRQKNEQLTNIEERRIVQQIEDLKQALPLAAPLQKLEDEKKTLEKDSKALKGKKGAAYKALKETQEKIDQIKNDLDEIKKMRETINDKSNPEIELAKKECSEVMEELKKQKHDAYEKHGETLRLYREQQEYIRYCDLVKNQIEWLKKQEKKKKHEEERKKREEEEKKFEEEKKKNKYLEFVEIAEALVVYLEKLSGKGDQKDYQDPTEPEQKAPTDNLTPEELEKLIKKDKLTVLVSKKDQSDKSQAFFSGGNKKGKGQKLKEQLNQQANQQTEKPKESSIDLLIHAYDILQSFEKLSVPAPTTKKDIEKTIELVNEKKQYFIDLPNKEESEQQPHAEKEEKDQNKHEKKNKKQAKMEFDESAFPTIQN